MAAPMFCSRFSSRLAKYGYAKGYVLKSQRKHLHPVIFEQHCRHFGQPAPQTHPHLMRDNEVTPGTTKDEYKARRYKYMEAILETISLQSPELRNKNHLVIVPSATKLFMAEGIPYVFRQNTDFLYLSGFLEPDSILMMYNTETQQLPEHCSVLFVPEKDPKRELWEGARSGSEGATELTGVDKAYTTSDVEKFLFKYLEEYSQFVIWYDYLNPVHSKFHKDYVLPFIGETKHNCIINSKPVFHNIRLYKSPSEVELLRKATEIAAESFVEVMRFSHSMINEASLFAKMDFECRVRGAQFLAYPPVVAGGNRANTIHYIQNNQIINDGDLVLMDAGCQYHGYVSDITRTWPVSGKFTPPQRALYKAVLDVQQRCIELCTTETTLDRIFEEMLEMIGAHLQMLGIIPKELQGVQVTKAARQFCPHHVSHWLGMDVHDTPLVMRNVFLKPGMVVTIEPGIYLPESNRSIPAQYRGIGIRIEDDVLITENGYEILSHKAPKDPDEIEALLARP